MRVLADLSDLRRVSDKLEVMRTKAVPHALRNGLNRAAFATRTAWQGEVRKTFTVRNSFTERQIVVDKATGLNPSTMVAVLGSRADFMDEREAGETKKARGRHGASVPQSAAAGQAGLKRTRLISRRFKLSALKLAPSAKTTRHNYVALQKAAKSTQAVYLKTSKGQGIFRVTGKRRKLRVRLLYAIGRPATVKPMPTLQTTLKRMERRNVHIMTASFAEQLRRHDIPFT